MEFYGEEVLGVITAISAAVNNSIDMNGDQTSVEIVKFKFESASITDEMMQDLFPEAIIVLRSMSPLPVKKMEFNKVFPEMLAELLPYDDQKEVLPGIGIESNSSKFGRVKIDKFSVTLKETDIPCYVFECSFPMQYGNPKDLYASFKQKVLFKFLDYGKAMEDEEIYNDFFKTNKPTVVSINKE